MKEIKFNGKHDVVSVENEGNTWTLVSAKGEKVVFSIPEIERKQNKITWPEGGEKVIEAVAQGTVSEGGSDTIDYAIAYFSDEGEGRFKGYSPRHHHNIGTEIYYIISGRAKVVVDGQAYICDVGESIQIDPKQKHQVFNLGPGELALIVSCSPPWSFEDYHLDPLDEVAPEAKEKPFASATAVRDLTQGAPVGAVNELEFTC